MLKKIRTLLFGRRENHNKSPLSQEHYTRDQVIKIAEDFGQVRYNDGKRDGIAIAREQATKSLKEIVWQQTKIK